MTKVNKVSELVRGAGFSISSGHDQYLKAVNELELYICTTNKSQLRVRVFIM